MKGSIVIHASTEEETRAAGAELASKTLPGDVVLLTGPLGAGKTTFVRGFVGHLGVREGVRSPTFNLVQLFDTNPPVLHADLYRVASHQGLGIEDYLDSHVCVIEWPDRAEGLVRPDQAWKVHIDFENTGRRIVIEEPSA